LVIGGEGYRIVSRPTKVDAHDLRTNETDDRGRIYLGTEYANKRVTVAVVEGESDRPDDEELAADVARKCGSSRTGDCHRPRIGRVALGRESTSTTPVTQPESVESARPTLALLHLVQVAEIHYTVV
jgi:hypothetical protein